MSLLEKAGLIILIVASRVMYHQPNNWIGYGAFVVGILLLFFGDQISLERRAPDDVLSELLNREYSLIEIQRLRESPWPDLLGCAARRAASALGAEIVKYSPLPALAA